MSTFRKITVGGFVNQLIKKILALTCRAGASSTSVGPSPGNWLAVHRVDLTLGKTAICIIVLWQDAVPFTNSDTFSSPIAPPVPY